MDKIKFEELWKLQFEFNEKFYKFKTGKSMEDLTMEERVAWAKNQILSIVKETMEVLDEMPNWKEHRQNESEFIPSNLFEEIIDVNKFAIGLAQLWGMSMEDYFKEYMRKSYVVEQRWQQEMVLKKLKNCEKVVGLDIDGVLGRYEDHFLNFILHNTGIDFDTIKNAKNRLGAKRYEEIKSSYRQSGVKKYMPPTKGAAEFTKYLKDLGYTIVILTARPYKKYYTIYPDTLEFLNNNEILFDSIIWDEEKHLKIIKEFPNMEFMVEDNVNIAKEIASEGYKVFLMTTNSNKEDFNKIGTYLGQVIIINELNDIKNYL